MASRKASKAGIARIKQKIAKKGWRVYDDRWLLAASQLLEPNTDWHEDGPYAYGCSPQTWERFIRGIAIRDRSFVTFSKVLDLDPDDITEVSEKSARQLKARSQATQSQPQRTISNGLDRLVVSS